MTLDDSFQAKRAAQMAAREAAGIGIGSVASGGGGTQPPDMEPRVIALEADIKDVKASLHGLEVSSARIEATLASLATKADAARVEAASTVTAGNVASLDGRLVKVEAAINDVVKTAVGKAIGPLQLPAIIVSTIVLLGLLLVGWNWMTRQPWFHGSGI